MADNNNNNSITSPLLTSDHLIVTIDSDSVSSTTTDTTPISNPFIALGCKDGELTVPAAITVDPFDNYKAGIEGLYEWLKTILCLPIALIRLVIFGLCLAIGYVATKLALYGWKDKENPMPKWRCRIMWVTRISARFILFSFGYHWIKRKGKPAPRDVAPIIVSNHVSYIEPIFYFYELFPTIVASESHDSIPFVGTIIRAMQVIYVNRFSQSSRKQAVREIKLMFRMFTQFHNFFEVEYLPVIPPLDDKETAVHFRKRASHAIATALNTVQTGHSYGDIMLHMKAQEAKQENPSRYMVEMAKVESLFHISSLEAVEFLDKFLAMNPDSSGCVQYRDFLSVIRLKACPLSEKIFSFIDVEKCGKITFRQFLYGSAHVMKQSGFHQACEAAFAECGGAAKGYIVEEELRNFIQSAIPSWNEDEVHDLFVLFDVDKDGRIYKDEFLSCLRRNPLLVAIFIPQPQHKESCGNGVLEIL